MPNTQENTMKSTATRLNPFVLMLDPETVISAMEASVDLRRLRGRVITKHGGRRHLAAQKPDALAVLQVDGGKQDHGGGGLARRTAARHPVRVGRTGTHGIGVGDAELFDDRRERYPALRAVLYGGPRAAWL